MMGIGEPQRMRCVLVNPVTKEPTCCAPPEIGARIFAGHYQNVAAVTEEWHQAELEKMAGE